MFNDPNVIAAIEAAEEAVGEAATCSTEGLQKYAISIPLISEPSMHYCIDNAGNAGGITKEMLDHVVGSGSVVIDSGGPSTSNNEASFRQQSSGTDHDSVAVAAGPKVKYY
jgi:hypothetical protein